MIRFRTRVSDTLDLNVALEGGPADQGLSYTIASESLRRAATINAATGLLTPTAPGVGIVEVRRLDNSLVVQRVLVRIDSDSQYAYDGTVPDSGVTFAVAPGFLPIGVDQIGAPNGVAGLDSAGKLDIATIPPGVGGGSGVIPSNVVLANNQAASVVIPALTIPSADANFRHIRTIIRRGTVRFNGTLRVALNGSVVDYSLDGMEFGGSLGLTFSVALNGANLEVSYTSDNQGANAQARFYPEDDLI